MEKLLLFGNYLYKVDKMEKNEFLVSLTRD